MTDTPENKPVSICKACGHPVLIEQFNWLVSCCARCGRREFTTVTVKRVSFEESCDARFRRRVAELGGYDSVMDSRHLRSLLVADAREIYRNA